MREVSLTAAGLCVSLSQLRSLCCVHGPSLSLDQQLRRILQSETLLAIYFLRNSLSWVRSQCAHNHILKVAVRRQTTKRAYMDDGRAVHQCDAAVAWIPIHNDGDDGLGRRDF